MINILHICAHLGGGIGTAYAGMLAGTRSLGLDITHSFLLMEKPIDKANLNKIVELGGQVYIHHDPEISTGLVRNADIVSIGWWHHPALYRFVVELNEIPCRLIVWSHVSGCDYPYLNVNFLGLCDKLLLTTFYSYENNELKKMNSQHLDEKTKVVYGLGNYNRYLALEKQEHYGFNIGYIGTVSFAKIHPDIEDYCAEVDVDNVSFIFVGKDDISRFIKNKALLKKMKFPGFTDRPWEVMQTFDVFGYLLSPNHYGSTENALLEAMASGIVPIALDQSVERYIIKHGETGFIVKSPGEYGDVVRYLHDNPHIRKKIGQNARQTILDKFDIKKNVLNLQEVYQQMLLKPKCKRNFLSAFGDEPFSWFLFGMNTLDKEKMYSILTQDKHEDIVKTLPKIYFQKSKGSIFHFAGYFPECEKLNVILEKIKNIEGSG